MSTLVSSHGVLAVQSASKTRSAPLVSFIDVASQGYVSQIWDIGRMTSMFRFLSDGETTKSPDVGCNKKNTCVSNERSNTLVCANSSIMTPLMESTSFADFHLCYSSFSNSAATSISKKMRNRLDKSNNSIDSDVMEVSEAVYDSDSDEEETLFFSNPSKHEKKVSKRGSHVALVYENPERCTKSSFFSAFVFRCDTWAIQWAIGPLMYSTSPRNINASEREKSEFSEVVSFVPTSHCALLHSGLLCGIAVPDDNFTVKINSAALFVAVQPPNSKGKNGAGLGRGGKRDFVAAASLFLLEEINVVEKCGEGNPFISCCPSTTSKVTTILENEKKKSSLTVLKQLAIIAVSDHSLIVLFASGGLYELRIDQHDFHSHRLVSQSSTANECTKGAADLKLNDLSSSSPRGGAHKNDINVTALYLGEAPGFPASPKLHASENYQMKVLHSADAGKEQGTVLAVYKQRKRLPRNFFGKAQVEDNEKHAVHLLPLSSSKRQWTEVVLEKGFSLLEVIDLIPDAFPVSSSQSSSAPSTPTPLLLLHLQEREAPFRDAVQGVFLVLSSTLTAVEDTILLPVIKFPSASLRLVESFYNANEGAHVLICASSVRARFFHEVQFSLFQSSLKTPGEKSSSDAMDASSKNDNDDLLLDHAESWLVTKIFYNESLGGYSSNALQDGGAEGENSCIWVPLLRPFSGRKKHGFVGTGGEVEECYMTNEEGMESSLSVQDTWKTTDLPGVERNRSLASPIVLTYPLTAFRTHPSAFPLQGASPTVSVPAVHSAFFSVSVSPGIHSRLAKQWHNGVQGLRLLIHQAVQQSHKTALIEDSRKCHKSSADAIISRSRDTMSTALDPLCLLLQHQWHPKHIRQVLRSLNAIQLGLFLRAVCKWISRTSVADLTQGSEGHKKNAKGESSLVWYFQAATSAVPLALHILSLAKQKGLSLTPFLLPVSSEDRDNILCKCFNSSSSRNSGNDGTFPLSPLLELLRSSRALGHPLRRLLPRMEMMVDTGRQHRLLHTLLVKSKKFYNATEKNAQDSEDTERCSRSFFGMSDAEFYVMRSLLEGHNSSAQGGDVAAQQKYIPNSWVRPLVLQEEPLSALVSETQGYLRTLEQDLDQITHKSGIGSADGENAFTCSSSNAELIDWRSWGRRAHSENFLRVFESGIMVQED